MPSTREPCSAALLPRRGSAGMRVSMPAFSIGSATNPARTVAADFHLVPWISTTGTLRGSDRRSPEWSAEQVPNGYWPRSPSAISSARTAIGFARSFDGRWNGRGSSSVGGAAAFQAACRGFESRLPLQSLLPHAALCDRVRPMSALPLAGRVAIVTGGARGIGRGIAARFVRDGAVVFIADHDIDTARRTAEELASTAPDGGHVAAIEADASDRSDLEAVVAAAVEGHGRLDIFVANAGIGPSAPFLETSEATWDAVLGLNLRGAFLGVQAAAKAMRALGSGGRI